MAPEILAAVKPVHVALAAASGLGFLVRGVARLRGARWLGARWARVLPHALDTLLLATGLVLAIAGGISPLSQPWFAAKLAALVAYIGLGVVALRIARGTAAIAAALALALAAFAWVAGAALTRDAVPFPI